MKFLSGFIGFLGLITQSYAGGDVHSPRHEMQHGFVLTADGRFASHLVATGHHSRQTEIIGELVIDDPKERAIYTDRRTSSGGEVYYLFQAQNLDLQAVKAGQLLIGHIVESKVGDYEPTNILVKSARYRVKEVLLNLENPFFKTE